jgi:ankyrin repeat protein
MLQPIELRTERPIQLHDGLTSTTTAVWNVLVASHAGDLTAVQALAAQEPALLTCQFNYTPPLHFAVREGHEALVRYLGDRGAFDPTYRTYPFLDSLVTVALDRGHTRIAEFLTDSPNRLSGSRKGDTGTIDYGQDYQQREFQRAVNHGDVDRAAEMLKHRPDLVHDEMASWAEGILMMPAKMANRSMLELLLGHGARVPAVSKWGREYYFKHADIAAFLLDHGMGPNHMTWHHVTLLHDMAQEGNVDKARLLLDHGADPNPVDDEYRSTPLGLAARWGQTRMVEFLLERGADPVLAGAAWATPLAWAERKGHIGIAARLQGLG